MLRADAGNKDTDGNGGEAWNVERGLRKVRGREGVGLDARKKARVRDVNVLPAIENPSLLSQQ
jgi:hypothetical protein